MAAADGRHRPADGAPPGVPALSIRIPRAALVVLAALLLTATAVPASAGPPAAESALRTDPRWGLLAERPAPRQVYVVPFAAVMVPPVLAERVFDQLVDDLNREGRRLGYGFLILKDPPASTAALPGNRVYLTGELFGYVEDSGCCTTEIRARARIALQGPEQDRPWRFEFPAQVFFDHDLHRPERQREDLARQIAEALAAEVLAHLAASPSS